MSGPALEQLGQRDDVVVVVVGEQHVRRRHALALGRLDQRAHRAAGVDEERGAAGLADEVGVGQELRQQGAFDDHAIRLRHAASGGYTLRHMPELIHTCYRIGDIDRSVAFYEALGFEELGRMPIRDEAINVFMGLPGDGPRLELTYNFGVDSYELGTGYNHIAITAEDLDATLAALAEQGIEPEKPPYTVSEGGTRSASCATPTATGSSSSNVAADGDSRLAVVDLGSNSFRLVVFEIHARAARARSAAGGSAPTRSTSRCASARAWTRPARSARTGWRARAPRSRCSPTSATRPGCATDEVDVVATSAIREATQLGGVPRRARARRAAWRSACSRARRRRATATWRRSTRPTCATARCSTSAAARCSSCACATGSRATWTPGAWARCG